MMTAELAHNIDSLGEGVTCSFVLLRMKQSIPIMLQSLGQYFSDSMLRGRGPEELPSTYNGPCFCGDCSIVGKLPICLPIEVKMASNWVLKAEWLSKC